MSTKGDFDLYDNIFARMYDERIINICGEIDETSSVYIGAKIHTLAKLPEDITLFISSFGGKVEPAGAIMRSIRDAQNRGCRVIGEVHGYAMSVAAVILQACDLRYASPEDILMVHGVSSTSSGDIRNQTADVELAKSLMDIHADFFANRNTSTEKQYNDRVYWRELLDDNYPHFYFGDEALKVGLIDEVIM